MQLKSLLHQARSQAAFTMIELLIVISILGILAVAVLSAINPIEQINRGRDTGSRSDAEQLLSALDRYYAYKGFYPWQQNPADTSNAGITFQIINDQLVQGNSVNCPILYRLSETTGISACTGENGAQELKISFVNKISNTGYNPLYIYNAGVTGSSTYVCFKPISNSFIQEAKDRFKDASGNAIAPPVDYPADAIENSTFCGGSSSSPNNCTCLP